MAVCSSCGTDDPDGQKFCGECAAPLGADYFTMARGQIEAFGGIVEKFIGDAAVGVFGVPAAHEDDPERAVRAGLRIVKRGSKARSTSARPGGRRRSTMP